MTLAYPHPDNYTYRVAWNHNDQQFVATVDEFPSLSWMAVSPDAAAVGLKAIVHETLLDLQRTGGAAPHPMRQFAPNVTPTPPPAPSYPGFPTFQMPAVQQNVNVRVGGGKGFVSTNHTFHLIMTFLTCGLWAPVWAFMAIVNGSRNTGNR